MQVPQRTKDQRWVGYPERDSPLVNAPEFIYDRLKYLYYERGRSSVKVILQGELGQYEMFLGDFMSHIPKGWPAAGVVGKWRFVKRGKNYGLTPVERFTPSHPDYRRRELVY